MGVHFTFEFNLGDKRRQADPTRKLGDVIFNRFSIDLDMNHHEISITSQRTELWNSGSELPSGLPLNWLPEFEGLKCFQFSDKGLCNVSQWLNWIRCMHWVQLPRGHLSILYHMMPLLSNQRNHPIYQQLDHYHSYRCQLYRRLHFEQLLFVSIITCDSSSYKSDRTESEGRMDSRYVPEQSPPPILKSI